MDLRFGLIGDRESPALGDKLGRLAADLPQQPVIEQLAEQFKPGTKGTHTNNYVTVSFPRDFHQLIGQDLRPNLETCD